MDEELLEAQKEGTAAYLREVLGLPNVSEENLQDWESDSDA